MLLRLIPLVMMVSLAAASGRPAVDVSGTFSSNWDEVSLQQDGNYVHGSYVCCGGGRIEGYIYEGRIIRYHWKQSGAEGEGVWDIVSGSRLEGTWGSGQSDSDGGRWDLERKPTLAN